MLQITWNAAKASHAMLLCQMEQGEIASYQDAEKIDRVGRANAQRHVTITQNNVQNLAHKKFCFKNYQVHALSELQPGFLSSFQIS